MEKLVALVIIKFAFGLLLNAQDFNDLAKTPPMGWNSWNTFHCDINEEIIKEVADAFVTKGLKDVGFEYIIIDDCWQVERDENGTLVADPKRFPSGIKSIAEYVHALGLKFGIYSDAGKKTCMERPGSRGHEYQDARTFAAWGVDYLKYDWCNSGQQNPYESYAVMSDALKECGRPVVFSICEWGTNEPWTWAKDIGHLWRISGDIRPCWDCTGERACLGVMNIVDIAVEKKLSTYAGPGHWNDPDMLEVGNPGLSDVENKSHFSLWAMMAAPLMLGNDVRNMSQQTIDLLTNKEVIAINQDKAGKQCYRFRDFGDTEIYRKHLQETNGIQQDAFLLLNRGNEPKKISLYLEPQAEVRDLWNKKNLGKLNDSRFEAVVEPHDCVLLKVSGLNFHN